MKIIDFIAARLDEEEASLDAIDSEMRGPVQAQIEANRLLLKLYAEWPILVETRPTFEEATFKSLDGIAVRMSQQIAWATNEEYVKRFGAEPPHTPFIKALASVWADHPDFDPSWRLA